MHPLALGTRRPVGSASADAQRIAKISEDDYKSRPMISLGSKGCRWSPPLIAAAVFLCGDGVLASRSSANELMTLHTNDVIAFAGAANIVAAQQFGFLETLMTLAKPGLNLRFRSLAREGDTVYAQPRDVKFPGIAQQLDWAAATVVLVQFGQSEILDPTHSLPAFVSAYRAFIKTITRPTRRMILVSPVAFESTGPVLPDLSLRNGDLQRLVASVENLASEMKAGFLNLHGPEPTLLRPRARLTSNGIHLTPVGHWYYDRLAAIRLGLGVNLTGIDVNPVTGALSHPDLEKLRQAILAKNRLWFAYSRPMNWAFLGGDRIEQPSSRDHRDPKIRWFPIEMEQFVSLIREEELNISRLAQQTRNP